MPRGAILRVISLRKANKRERGNKMKKLLLLCLTISLNVFALPDIEQLFLEPNAVMSPFSTPEDPYSIEKERYGSGWRYINTGSLHKNVIINNTGRKGRLREYYKFAIDHPIDTYSNPGRDLYKKAKWFDKKDVSFYSAIKQTKEIEDDYAQSIEGIEIFYHMRDHIKKLHGDDVNICYVGHSEGGSSAVISSLYLKGKHVAISPGDMNSRYRLSTKNIIKDKNLLNQLKNLTVLIGGDEVRSQWEDGSTNDRNPDYSLRIEKAFKGQSNVVTKLIPGYNHRHIAAHKYIDEVGRYILEGCGF